MIKLRYGVDPREVDERMASQHGLCAICRKAEASHIDHDHQTRKIRGLLCFNCNALLGLVDDDLIWFERAIAYLERRGYGDVREAPARYIIHVA